MYDINLILHEWNIIIQWHFPNVGTFSPFKIGREINCKTICKCKSIFQFLNGQVCCSTVHIVLNVPVFCLEVPWQVDRVAWSWARSRSPGSRSVSAAAIVMPQSLADGKCLGWSLGFHSYYSEHSGWILCTKHNINTDFMPYCKTWYKYYYFVLINHTQFTLY